MPRPSRAPTLMTVYPGHSGAVTWKSAAATSVSDSAPVTTTAKEPMEGLVSCLSVG